ncbi:UBP1-associated protein 2A-like [Phoenix dactylifera]|uniref:UBP1-associated protein 2A-like n=1 Tax=Phoenix dactylifera TaxID=42345 RepID=A0A8B7CSC0_PHODC|nr:UBP1-associated protein 2A-like [Phoenix dactylifera]XP_008805341.1 UBP1-associated protein 2A-like [Phoenix dactylifera]
MAKKRKLANKAEPVEDPAPESTTQEPRDEEEPISQEDPTEEEPIGQEEPFEEEQEEPIHQESPAADDQIPETSDTSKANPDPSGSAGNGVAGDEDEENDPASIQNLLEPFPKDHLMEILRDAAVKYPDVLEEVHRIADIDPAHRKVFVHGLGWDTNVETLVAAFRQYGEIEDCNAVTDKATGKSKGYGFILFKHRSGARRALKQPQKKIGNRMTACQLASTGPVPPPAPPVSEYTQRKIFISNVGTELDPYKLLQFFSKFGEIEEGPLGLDKMTGKPKGFCLFVYKTIESARKALEEPHKNFEGHILHCQKAIDGPKPNKPGFHLQVPGSQHAGSHFTRSENAGFIGGVGSHLSGAGTSGHLMAPSAAGLGLNQGAQPAAAAAVAAAAAGLNPTLGQALTAFLASQGAGLGLTNLLGTLGSAGLGTPAVNQVVPSPMVNSGGHGMQGTYVNQVPAVAGNMNAGVMGGYVVQAPTQGGYGNTQIGQGGAGRNQQGLGHMGGVRPYMGH